MIRLFLLALTAAVALPAEATHEFIYTEAPFPSCHASTIMETRSGELLASWFGGTDEGENDVAIWISRKTADGWSAPEEFARHENTPTWNPVLFRTLDGVTWLFYKFGTSPREWTGAFRSSQDDGRTWSDIQPMPTGLLGPVRNKPLILPDGTVVAGSSHESYRSWTAYAEITRRPGETWTRSGPAVLPDQPYGVIQPAVVPIRGGLRMFLRTRNVGKIGTADSYDGGLTWSPVSTIDLPNPNSGIDAVGLEDGRIVLVYNHTERGRTPLNVAVSADEGKTWNSFLALETEPGEYSYPAVIQHTDGAVHITYTWKRERIKHVTVPLPDIP